MTATPPIADTDAVPMDSTWPPILGICGHSGSGKTTLAEELARHLTGEGLSVGYVKHCHGKAEFGHGGKDTDKLFQAGAAVVGHGDCQVFTRRREAGELHRAIELLGKSVDIVLAEGHKASRLPKLWMLPPDEDEAPNHAANVIAALPFAPNRLDLAKPLVADWLAQRHAQVPLAVGVLAGGMGRPAAMRQLGDGGLLDHVVDVAGRVSDCVALLGGAAAPDSRPSMPRLADVPSVSGPLAGILAAFRWAPDRRWLILPCNLPRLSEEALRLLLAGTRPGCWAVLPGIAGKPKPDPLAALLDPPMGPLFEDAKRQADQSPWHAIDGAKTHVVEFARPLADAWMGARVNA